MPTEVSEPTTKRVTQVLAGLASSALSFRVLVALSTSLAVTGAVAAPLAVQVARSDGTIAAPAPAPDAGDEPAAPADTTEPTEPATEPEPTEPAPPDTSAPTEPTPEETTTTVTTTTVVDEVTTTTEEPAPTTTVPSPTSNGIVVTEESEERLSGLLNGAFAAGPVFITFNEPAESVSFYLDRPIDGNPDRVDTEAPFDFKVDEAGTPVSFDTTTLSVGYHTLAIVVEGGEPPSVRIAVFTTDESLLD